ncbi:MAG: hypothetical protein R3344_07855, partial [Acidobacteriota bacterium]|nr:hypothetical protein [Acidobacteriota bacterium]
MSHRIVMTITLLSLAVAVACGQGGEGEAPAQPAKDRGAGPAIAAIEIPNWRTPAEGLLTGGQPTREQLAEAAEA